MPSPSSPVGVFDSGIGGLSILKALRGALPAEDFVYFSDAAHAPYGERDEAFVTQRTLSIARELVVDHDAKLLVVACNTATAAAVAALRATWPQIPVVGVEPALKPAVAATRTGRIAVFATQGTLASAKFQSLLQTVAGEVQVVTQPCVGLASAIEAGDDAAIDALCARYLELAGPFGTATGQADVLVLGCTHYAFAHENLQRRLDPQVRILETGEPVARQASRLLAAGGLLRDVAGDASGQLTFVSSGDVSALKAAASRWLGA